MYQQRPLTLEASPVAQGGERLRKLIIECNPHMISDVYRVNPAFVTKEMCAYAVGHRPELLHAIPQELLDRDIIALGVKKSGCVLHAIAR